MGATAASLQSVPVGADSALGWLALAISNTTGLRLRLDPAAGAGLDDWMAVLPPGEYVVRLTLTNWAQSSAAADVRLSRTPNPLSLVAQIQRLHLYSTVTTATALRLEASATCCACGPADTAASPASAGSSSGCALGAVHSVPSFEWALVVAASGAVVSLGGTQQAARFYVPPYTLQPDVEYIVQLTATGTLGGCAGLTAQASFPFMVKPALPSAAIRGGDRLVSAAAATAPAAGPASRYLVLDGGGSSNLDFPTSTWSQAWRALGFSWRCQVRRTFDQLGLHDCGLGIFQGGLPCTGSRCVVDLSAAAREQLTYLFTLTVWPLVLKPMPPIPGRGIQYCSIGQFEALVAAGQAITAIASVCPGNASATSTATVQVAVTAAAVPTLFLAVASPLITGRTRPYTVQSQVVSAAAVANADVPLSLQATLGLSLVGSRIVSITWRLANYPASDCLDPEVWCHKDRVVSQQAPAAELGALDDAAAVAACAPLADASTRLFVTCGSTLLLAPYALRGSGVYNWSIMASDAAGGVARASLLLYTNQPPYGGTLAVSPDTNGTALTTRFRLSTVGWVDPEEPASVMSSYKFGYRPDGCSAAACEVLLTQGPSASTTALLPAGKLTVLVYALDSDGSTSRPAMVRIEVAPAADAAAAVASALSAVSTTQSLEALGLLVAIGKLLAAEGAAAGADPEATGPVRAAALATMRQVLLPAGWANTDQNATNNGLFVAQAAAAVVGLLGAGLPDATRAMAASMLVEIAGVVFSRGCYVARADRFPGGTCDNGAACITRAGYRLI